ncbi:hypothetical protein KPH14_006528 [Odynerus spinipes]|uniref:Uncharacterized protein n=1 Tax=Odynerus spinipes TaxID=1348599 RepID=A0AAD9RQK0_9HYME|nr:hypothetical protein KPH14_006528 [Odynerus spinipes]
MHAFSLAPCPWHVTSKRNVTKRTNAVTNDGQTALDIAQKLGYTSVIETLKTVTELSLPRHIRSLSKRNTEYKRLNLRKKRSRATARMKVFRHRKYDFIQRLTI